MITTRRVARVSGPPAPPTDPRSPGAVRRSRVARRLAAQDGMLSLEAAALFSILALLVVALLEMTGVVRDILVVHEAARVGARAAATTTGTAPVRSAVLDAAEELEGVRVQVDPVARGDGDIVTVVVTAQRKFGDFTYTVRARSVARVEPAVGTMVRGVLPP